MALLSQTDVEAYTDYTYTDFLQAGAVMTSLQWASYIPVLTAAAESVVNKYCNRTSFEIATYTEYHDGRGRTGDRGQIYRELDRVFFPVEQPVSAITTVHEDVNSPDSAESWTLRTPRSALVSGDYQVIVRDNLTRIRFHDNVPHRGNANVKMVYSAGYATSHPAYAAARMAALEIVANVLARRKRDEQAQTAAREPTRNAADMFQMQRPEIFTKEIKMILAPFRRQDLGRIR